MRALFELVSGLILLMASFVSSAITQPLVGLAPFPTDPILHLCGSVPASYGTFAQAELEALISELQRLEPAALEERICAARTREEVAYGLAVLGASQAGAGREPAMLVIAADQYANPLAMASLGQVSYREGDYAAAWRYLQASVVVGEQVGVERACRSLGRRAWTGLGARKVRELFDRDVVRPSTDRFVERRVALHRAIYGVPRSDGN